MGKTQKVGALGEELVAKFLMKRGFTIADRNFRKKWGELDVITKKKNVLHFVEVKSVSRNLYDLPKYISPAARESQVTHETSENRADYFKHRASKDTYRPEDNIHPMKIARLKRAIQSYILSGRVSSETKWQFDVAAVFIDLEHKKVRIDFIENIIL
jgi:Holliday junction resolvase-like predicted endonuclease